MKLGTLALALIVAGSVFLFIVEDVLHEVEVKRLSVSPSSSRYNSMATPNPKNEVLLPSVSFSLAAIVRRQQSQQQPRQSQYALVHERPPRGWWLPGGGIEHIDDTPVDAAIRETVEEAGSPSLLPLLPLLQSMRMTKDEEPKLRLLPSMTHLISLEQSPGRLRFIFRGEWIDDFVDNCDDQTATSNEPKNILKCPPGDKESIEAKWLTWDEVQCLKERKRGKQEKSQPSTAVQSMSDPWLRGHEPLTFYEMLERSWQENGSVPGLPVHMMNLSGEHDDQQEEEVTGAFFGRMRSSSNKSNRGSGLTYHGRAALLTHLKCRLLVYDNIQQQIALDTATKMLPSSFVHDQNEMTLKQLVDGMIAELVALPSEDNREKQEQYQVGLLRVEYVVHGNGREATLTVFPFVCLSSTDGVFLSESANETMSWVSGEEISDTLERKLAKTVLSEGSGKSINFSLNILRDEEGPV